LSPTPPNEWVLLRWAAVCCVVLTALVAAGSALPDNIGQKQAEARQVLAHIQALGRSLDRATEAYDGATLKLNRIRESLRVNKLELDVARHNYEVAEQRLGARLRDLYITGPSDPTLAVILGARSLDQIITELDTANRISQADTEVVRQVVQYRSVVQHRRELLAHARKVEEQVVAERKAAQERIAGGLAEQKRMLSSIRSEIVVLQREEAAREAQLAAEARARLLQQRLAQQAALNDTVVGASAVSPLANGVTTVVPPSAIGSRVVAIAMQYLGRPYVWGAAGPSAFDCSGLVQYVFAQVGISLPHFAASQWNYGEYVSIDQLEPGDLVFFENLGHVGIYVGNGEYINAPQPGESVDIVPLSDPWSAANYYGAKRIVV
jgi:cell wall-associated NlpC family hydrolase